MFKYYWMFKIYIKLSFFLLSYIKKIYLEVFNFFCDVKIKEV